MSYQPLDAGSLDKRVTIQSRVGTDDDGGGQTITWTDVAGWYVSISPTGGREFAAAQQIQPELTHEVKGRFRTDVTAKHRLRYVANNVTRHFAIHATLDPMERHEQLVCYCSEIAQT